VCACSNAGTLAQKERRNTQIFSSELVNMHQDQGSAVVRQHCNALFCPLHWSIAHPRSITHLLLHKERAEGGQEVFAMAFGLQGNVASTRMP
jgi:hypothetical protein